MRGPPQRLGTRVAQLGVVAQASPGGIRVRQRDAARRLRLGVGREAVVAPSAAALLVLRGFHVVVASERRNIMNSTTPRPSATMWSAPKITISSSSGVMREEYPD